MKFIQVEQARQGLHESVPQMAEALVLSTPTTVALALIAGVLVTVAIATFCNRHF